MSHRIQIRLIVVIAAWAAGAALMASVVAPARAAVVLADDFSNTTGGITASNGDPPDTVKWSTAPIVFAVPAAEGTLDGAGHLMTSSANPAMSALPSYGTTPGTGDARLTVQLTSFAGGGYFGLENSNPFATWSAIYIRNDEDIYWHVSVYNNGAGSDYNTGVSTTVGSGTWTIDWTASQIVINLDNSLFPITVTSGLPTAALYPFVNDYNGTSAKFDSITYDNIAVPEPATASLLVVGGTLSRLCRRRRA
jgi:hypothetical protein